MASAQPLTGLCVEEAALEWLVVMCLLSEAQVTRHSLVKETRGIANSTLSLPAAYVAENVDDIDPAKRRTSVSQETARKLEDLLATLGARTDQADRTSIPALFSRLKMTPETWDIVVPASYAGPLFEAIRSRPSHEVRVEERHLLFDAASRLLANAEEASAVLPLINQHFGGIESYIETFVDPVLAEVVRPPNKSVTAVTQAARLWRSVPLVRERFLDEALKPLGFRVFRVYTYLTKINRSVGVSYALDAVKRAELNKRRVDAYPGRSLEVDTAKELLLTGPRGAERDYIVGMLTGRAADRRRPYRERSYAMWVLDNFGDLDDAAHATIAGALDRDGTGNAEPLRELLANLPAWRKDVPQPDGPPLPVLGLEIDSVDETLTDVVRRSLGDQQAIGDGTRVAVRRHLLQGLLTPNGRWRRQVCDAFVAASIKGPVSSVLVDVLEGDHIPLGVKDRATFMLGFVQPEDPRCLRTLIDLAGHHMPFTENVQRTELAHAALHALADSIGLRSPSTVEPRLRDEAIDLMIRGLGYSAVDRDTSVDIAAAYGLRVLGHPVDELPDCRSEASATFHNRPFRSLKTPS